jgi:hypothetical protein
MQCPKVCIQSAFCLNIVCIRSEPEAPNAKVTNPIPGVFVTINMYLQAHHVYRVDALNKPEIKLLSTMSHDALDTL